MNNQQAIRIQMLAYIAGCIDSDGTIGIHVSDQYGNYKPTIKVFNTNKDMIELLGQYALALRLPYFIHVSNPKRSNGGRYKPLYALDIQGIKRISIWLPLLIPFLHIKRKQAELALQFSKLRLETPMTRANYGRSYTDEQMAIIQQIQTLNNENGKGRSRKSSQTMSKTQETVKI